MNDHHHHHHHKVSLLLLYFIVLGITYYKYSRPIVTVTSQAL